MPDTRFIGLVHALRASAEAALGDDDGPLRLQARSGVRGPSAAERSLGLLEMLHAKTRGNLDATERDTLWSALRAVRERVARGPAASGADARVTLPTANDDEP